MKLPKIGILGAGKLGMTLARLARNASYDVLVATAEPAGKINLTVRVLAPGAVATEAAELATAADIIVLALPLSGYKNIPKSELKGKLVIDAMNHWWEVDGPREDIIPADVSSSEAVQQYLNESQVVKALNHVGYHDLYDNARPDEADLSKRVAIALAGDDKKANARVAGVIENLGFATLYVGKLSSGVKLEPGSKAFGASVGLQDLSKAIE